MSDSIEIRIAGPRVTPDAFKKAVEAFFALIQGVSKNVTGRHDAVEWGVEVSPGSAIIRVRSSGEPQTTAPGPAMMVIGTISHGIRSLKSGIRSTPTGFTKDEMRAVRILAGIADGTNVSSVSIKNGGAPEELVAEVLQTADAILAGERSFAYGSIEGKIDSLADKDSFVFTVYEPNYKRSINCSFDKKELDEEAYRAFRKRVLVSGMIRYGKEGYPTSIAADTLRVFPDESELPTLEEIQAIYREIYKE